MSQYFSYIYISKQKMRPFLVIFKPKENPFLNPILASFEVLQYDSPPLKKSAVRILSKDKMSSFCQVLRSSPSFSPLLLCCCLKSNSLVDLHLHRRQSDKKVASCFFATVFLMHFPIMVVVAEGIIQYIARRRICRRIGGQQTSNWDLDMFWSTLSRPKSIKVLFFCYCIQTDQSY